MSSRSVGRAAGALAIAWLLAGCSADDPLNPSFPLRWSAAADAIEEMAEDPVPLERPVVILGGMHDPGFAAPRLASRLRRMFTDDTPIIHVSFFETWSFDSCRRKLLRTIEQRLPSDDPDATIDLDVIGVSMGGIVARYAALPAHESGRQLRINRLFTIASPHQGANLANLPTFDARAIDLRAGSPFLARLDAAIESVPYELYPYGRLGDMIVGPRNMARTGDVCWWVTPPPLSPAHLAATRDLRIIADIARRLRGEEPFTLEPRAPLP